MLSFMVGEIIKKKIVKSIVKRKGSSIKTMYLVFIYILKTSELLNFLFMKDSKRF